MTAEPPAARENSRSARAVFLASGLAVRWRHGDAGGSMRGGLTMKPSQRSSSPCTWLRTDTELLLKSRRVVPARLLDAGFGFEHPDWPAAAGDLVARRRAAATALSG